MRSNAISLRKTLKTTTYSVFSLLRQRDHFSKFVRKVKGRWGKTISYSATNAQEWVGGLRIKNLLKPGICGTGLLLFVLACHLSVPFFFHLRSINFVSLRFLAFRNSKLFEIRHSNSFLTNQYWEYPICIYDSPNIAPYVFRLCSYYFFFGRLCSV